MIIVSDSSPLLNLAVIGKLELLTKIFGKILIPEAVYEEITIKGEGAIGVKEIKNASWIEIRKCRNLELLKKLWQNLDAGESEAIVLAIELKSEILLIDEIKGRRIAENYNLKIIGLLGILLEAKKKGHIDHVKGIVEDLINKAGFWMSQDLYNEVLTLANE